ncbi:hypothetical protein ACOSP7_011455 [Xanthoceras sorbifolium]
MALPDQPALDMFLQCLSNHTQPSNPISESIHTPKYNSSFQSVLTAYDKNRRFLTAETPKPLAIVVAKHESHVQATVICAKGSGLQLRIRSGGHDYEGLSYTSTVPFVILDMFNLRFIDIDITNQTAWVQAGATLGELYYKISNTSKLHGFPAGICPFLGVGGHFSRDSVSMFLGQTKSFIPLMKRSFPELGIQVRDCKKMSWVESVVFWADFLEEHQLIDSFKSKSDYVKTVIPKEGLEKIWKKMIDLQVNNIFMQWNPYGGRMSEISESETAFPHRTGNLFKIQYLTSWVGDEGNINVTNRYMNELRDFYASMASYVSTQLYGFKYFKGNFQRLMKVKTKVDPHNFFKNEQSIPPQTSTAYNR